MHSAKVTWFAEKDFIDCNSMKDVISIGIITQTGGSASFSSNMLTTFPFRELWTNTVDLEYRHEIK